MSVSRYCWCGIYTRQSRDTNSEYSSCKAQFDACSAYVTSRFNEGWVCNGRRYEEEAESSETLERPGLQRLLEHIRDGKFDRVVIHRLDRLSRRLVDCIGFLQELQDRQVPLTIVTQPELGTSAEHPFFLHLMASFAEFEQEMTRERLADARAALKRRGRRVAGVIPYGYEADPVKKQLTSKPREARRVRKVFQWAGEGKTPRQIAEIANRRGWRTKTRDTKKTGQIRSGGRWTPRQVLTTLSTPVCAGKIRDRDVTRPGSHNAIVDVNIFDRAQDKVASRRTRQPGRESPKFSWPLHGLLFFGQCDRVMSPSVSGYKNLRYRCYRCRAHAGGRPPCPGASVPAHEIERYVLDLLGNAGSWQTENQLKQPVSESVP